MTPRALLVAAYALGVLLCGDASQAMSRKTPAISDLFYAAGRVVMARIDENEILGECGTRYTATVLASFKGKSAAGGSEIIKFGRGDELQRGAVYLLFLSYIADPWEMLDRVPAEMRAAAHTDDKFLEAAKCHGLVPGYEFDQSLVGVFENEQFVLEITPGFVGAPSDLPRPFVKADPYGREFVVMRDSIGRYLDRLGRAQ